MTERRFPPPFVLICLLGSCAASTSGAAEWSAAPVMSWSVDHHSNRSLREDPQPNQAGSMNFDASLKRETPTWILTLRPRINLNRYTREEYSDSDNRSLAMSSRLFGEHSVFDSSLGMSELSTLTSELEETGLVEGDTRKRTKEASAGWTWQHSETRALVAQAGYTDVDYRGLRAAFLPGYRYPSLSIGERFDVSDRMAITASAFAGQTRSSIAGRESRNVGVQVSVERALSERITAVVSLGASERKIAGEDGSGAVGELRLTRQNELGRWQLSYSHSLAPTGYGVLIERDEAALSVSRSFAPRLAGNLRIRGIRNSDLAFVLTGERRRYEAIEAGLDFRTGETSTLGLQVSASQAEQTAFSDTAEGWRVAASFTWTPRPRILSP